ncbi:flagella synthesis protein FlgN [Legionella clemsonensis]|uniref:FlgN protein n=1 Tax=Legionella clemsonensis TaxID=1867846 RepID=A0A222P2Q1_9GAMM|nr:flagellar protein FlgN [Legionella clemsonensis]ASQ46119.1 FlgN protein [Legionella clemsonensis]
MTDAKPIQLIQILEQEINFVEQLIALLEEEKNALITRQFDLLESLANQKQMVSNQLEQITQQRTDLLGVDLQVKSAKESLKDFLAQCSTQEAAHVQILNAKLAEKLILCRELNAVNGQVITSNIYTRQEIINTITGQVPENTTSVYTASGGIKSSNDSNNYQKA